jgi:hypothetical protein
MGFVRSYLEVCGLDRTAQFGFKDAAAICIQGLVSAVEPMMYLSCDLPADSRVTSFCGITMDVCIPLRSDFEEDGSPYWASGKNVVWTVFSFATQPFVHGKWESSEWWACVQTQY